jgi:hypothetical protein
LIQGLIDGLTHGMGFDLSLTRGLTCGLPKFGKNHTVCRVSGNDLLLAHGVQTFGHGSLLKYI